MEDHLDVHYGDFPYQGPVVGKVTAVWPKDHPQNKSGKITLYQVVGLLQRPSMRALIGDSVPYMGQHSGRTIEGEEPLEKDDLVIVGFLEGDPNRPFIMGPYFDESQVTNAAQTVSEYPKTHRRIRGVNAVIDKNGDVQLDLVENQGLTVKDSAGNVIFEIRGGEVRLGGNTGIKALMMENMISVFNSHVHTGVTTGAGSSGSPATPLVVGTHSTTVTKAK